jgi:hypothetical protein
MGKGSEGGREVKREGRREEGKGRGRDGEGRERKAKGRKETIQTQNRNNGSWLLGKLGNLW